MKPVAEISFEMKALLTKLGLKLPQFEARYKLTAEHVEQFVDDSWLQIRRSELQVLVAVALSQGLSLAEFVNVRVPHPVWETFADRPTMLFRGRKRSGASLDVDLSVQRELTRGMELQVHENQYPHNQPPEPERLIRSVSESLKTKNCIFLGGPKYNPYTEAALSELWQAKAFAPGSHVPVRFICSSLDEMHGPSSFCQEATQKRPHGLEVLRPGAAKALPLETKSAHGSPKGWDLGVLVVCRRPPGATEDVTTVVIAGHQTPATMGIVQNLIDGLPYFGPLKDGVPVTHLFVTSWRRIEGEPRPARKLQRFFRMDADLANMRRTLKRDVPNAERRVDD